MAEHDKELTILVAAGCRIATAIMPFWDYCQNLGTQINRCVGGGVSIKFDVGADIICEFRWRGRHVATIYTYGAAPGEVLVDGCNPSELLKSYPLTRVWDEALRPAFIHLLSLDRKNLEEVARRVNAGPSY